jgi:DNA-binding XRE family transcriptional regulator
MIERRELTPRGRERKRQRNRDTELARFARVALADPTTHPLRRARLLRGWTTDDLAAAADRLSPATVGDIEKGRSPGSRHTRLALSRALRRPLKDLFE